MKEKHHLIATTCPRQLDKKFAGRRRTVEIGARRQKAVDSRKVASLHRTSNSLGRTLGLCGGIRVLDIPALFTEVLD